jgi:hypothetical protein
MSLIRLHTTISRRTRAETATKKRALSAAAMTPVADGEPVAAAAAAAAASAAKNCGRCPRAER